MQAPCITLYTEAQKNFRYTDGYEGVSVADLETLLRQGREATVSLEGELMKRQHERTSDQPGELGKCCQRIHNTARELNIMERLDGRAAKQVNDAVEILTTPHTSSPSKTYQAFLHDILRHCSPSLVLLCAASIGKKRVVDLGLKDRVNLLSYLRDTQLSLDSSVLKALTNEYQIPSSDNSRLASTTNLPRKRARDADTTEDTLQPEDTEQSRSLEVVEHGVEKVILSGEGRSTDQFTGDVYNLTAEDAQSVATSDQIQGQIWLTNP